MWRCWLIVDARHTVCVTRTVELCLGFTAVALVTALVAGCDDSADSWRTVELSTDVDFADIHFLDQRTGWMVGGSYAIEGGFLARTDDGGNSWRFRSGLVGSGSRLRGVGLNAIVFLDDEVGLIAGDRGVILKTEDGGENWRFVHRGPRISFHLFSLSFLDDETGWAVGIGGLLRTDDGGEHWRYAGKRRGGISGRDVFFIDEDSGFVVGQHGRISRSDDGGETWQTLDVLPRGETPYLWDVFFLDDLRGWVAGEHGTLLSTRDGGETWHSVGGGIDATLFLTAVRFVDMETGWIAGYEPHQARSTILRTRDGGRSWQPEISITGEELRALEVLDVDHAWAIGERARRDPQQLLIRRGHGKDE